MLRYRQLRGLAAAVLLAAALPVLAAGAEYVDPAQLDLPFPYFSFTRQPWRSYVETVPATTYRDGLGIVWNASVPGQSDEQTVATLARAGFRRVRLELPWGALRWDESAMNPRDGARALRLLRSFRQHGMRPLILLNANHGAPCPLRFSVWRIAQDAPQGSREVVLDGPATLVVPGRTELIELSDAGRPGPLITGVKADGRTVQLSRPLPAPLAAGSSLRLAELKYLPLAEVGSAAYEHTAAGWLHYVRLITHWVTATYGEDFDVELWNELTFGSAYLDLREYYDPRPAGEQPDPLHAGGRVWELMRRSVAAIHEENPRVQAIWGFSNTTFFHTAVTALPPGLGGQSYHPYGTGPRCYAKIVAGREKYNVGGVVPAGCAVMPEGWAHTFQQTETLMRLLNPTTRAEHPPGPDRFLHYITEHGFEPRWVGIQDPDDARRAKAKFLLRAPLFWLNKGISGFYVYSLYEADDGGAGLLRADGAASPALEALRRAVEFIGDAEPLSGGVARQLTVRAAHPVASALRTATPGARAMDTDGAAVLPFQAGPGRFLLGLYVMTEDFPQDLAPRLYHLSLQGLAGRAAALRFYDPLDDRSIPVRVTAAGPKSLDVELELTDSPRLLEIREP